MYAYYQMKYTERITQDTPVAPEKNTIPSKPTIPLLSETFENVQSSHDLDNVKLLFVSR